MKVRNAYERMRVQSEVSSESRTKQSHKAECDINTIMKRYQKTGQIAHQAARTGFYGYAPAADYREALEIIDKADELFMALPSLVRERFKNDPAEFLGFVQNPANKEELGKLGLLKDPPPTPPAPPPPSPPAK